MKVAILVAMANEPPFDEIHSKLHPSLSDIYHQWGFETFFVYGRDQGPRQRKLRRALEEVRWGRYYLLQRVFDLFSLSIYKWVNPSLHFDKNKIFVEVPEDLRHLSVKILHATKALESRGFDAVVRTTASSLFNPCLLVNACLDATQHAGIFYGGRKISQQDGFAFVSGSFSIWNSKAIQFLSSNQRKLDFSLIDDVCFGRMFERFNIDIAEYPSVNLVSKEQVWSLADFEKIMHFRCRTGTNHRSDLEVMKQLLVRLQSIKE